MKNYQDAYSKHWDRNLDLLFGKTQEDAEGKNQCAYGWGLVQTLITSIFVHYPEMLVEAYNAMGVADPAAKMLNAILPYDFDQMDLKSIGNLAILDNFVAGYSAVIESVQSDTTAIRIAAKGEADGEEGEEQEISVVKDQRYIARRIPPKDIMFDPQGTALDLSDHRYIACAWYPTIGQLRADEALNKDLPDELDTFPEASTYDRSGKKGSTSKGSMMQGEDEKDPEFRTICVWEIFDKVNHEIIYMTDFKHKIIGTINWTYDLKIGGRDLFPVTLMAFYPSTTGFYPKPIVDVIAGQLSVLNKLNSMIYEDATTKWRKWVTWSDVLTPDQIGKLTDANPANSIIEADPDIISTLAQGAQHSIPDLHDIVVAVPDPHVQQDVAAVRDMVIGEISDIIGFGSPARGGMPKTRSAREAMAIKEKMETRLHRLSDSVTEFFRQFGMKHILMLQQTQEIERYVKVFQDEVTAFAAWQKYTREDIKGTFHFQVFAGTSMPRNTESKKQQEITFFNALAPILQQAGYPLEPMIIRVCEAYSFKGMEKFFQNYKKIAKEGAKLLYAIGHGQQVKPQLMPEAFAALVQACLSPGEMTMVKQELASGGSSQGGGGGAPQERTDRGDSNPAGTSTGTF